MDFSQVPDDQLLALIQAVTRQASTTKVDDQLELRLTGKHLVTVAQAARQEAVKRGLTIAAFQ